MPDYKSMYLDLFNSVTDAIEILRKAQKKAETTFVNSSKKEKEKADNRAEKAKDCKNCMEMKCGECFGQKNICEFYRYSPSATEETKRNWPKYGDATALKIGEFRRYRR